MEDVVRTMESIRSYAQNYAAASSSQNSYFIILAIALFNVNSIKAESVKGSAHSRIVAVEEFRASTGDHCSAGSC